MPISNFEARQQQASSQNGYPQDVAGTSPSHSGHHSLLHQGQHFQSHYHHHQQSHFSPNLWPSMSCESFGAGPNSGSPEFNVGSDLAMHRNLHRASSRNTFTLTDDPIGADLSSPSQIHSSQQLLQPSTLIVSFPKFSSVQDEAAATDKIFDGASMLMEEKLKANEYHRYVARMVENQTGAHVEAFHLEESTMESVGLTSFKIRKAANELAPTFIIRGMPANVQSANEALLNQFSSSSSVIKFRIPEEAYGNESLIDRIDPEHRYDLSFAEDGPVLEVKEGLYSIEEIRTKCRLEIHKLCGRHVEIVKLPQNAVCLVLGAQGKRLLRTCLTSGVIFEAPFAVFGLQESCDSNAATILVVGQDPKVVKEAAKELETLNQETKLSSQSMELEGTILDWLLVNPKQRSELIRIMQGHGTCFIQDSSTRFSVYGESEGLVKMTMKAIYEQLYEYQTVSINFVSMPAYMQKVEKSLALLASTSNATISMSQSSMLNRIRISGSKSAVEATVSGLQRGLPILQSVVSRVTWSFATTAEVRDFVSGKKDGKLVKIMRETDVGIGLEGLGEEHLRIDLVGQSIGLVMTALGLVRGELPAEITFYIPETHHKRLIGHGGKVIQQVMKKHAVYIKFLNSAEARDRVHGTNASCNDPNNVCTIFGPSSRLDNVIVRTPAKNGVVLESVKLEVFAMADMSYATDELLNSVAASSGTPVMSYQAQPTHQPLMNLERKSIKLSKTGLLGISEEGRKQLAQYLLHAFVSTIDIGLSLRRAWFEDDLMVLKLAGSLQAISKLTSTIQSGVSEEDRQKLFQVSSSSHYSNPNDSTLGSPNFSPTMSTSIPSSPTTTTRTLMSFRSATSSQGFQELFGLFNSALYSSITSPSISTSILEKAQISGGSPFMGEPMFTSSHPRSPLIAPSDSEWSGMTELSWSPKLRSPDTFRSIPWKPSTSAAPKSTHGSGSPSESSSLEDDMREAARIFDTFYDHSLAPSSSTYDAGQRHFISPDDPIVAPAWPRNDVLGSPAFDSIQRRERKYGHLPPIGKPLIDPFTIKNWRNASWKNL